MVIIIIHGSWYDLKICFSKIFDKIVCRDSELVDKKGLKTEQNICVAQERISMKARIMFDGTAKDNFYFYIYILNLFGLNLVLYC